MLSFTQSRMLKILSITLLFFFFQARDASDDPHPEWTGQKLWCNDYKANTHPCHCALATSCDAHKEKNPDLYGDGDAEMGTRCSTHCKRNHCHCGGPRQT